ncbi:MAG: polysaccharide deacetylase family protein [Pseudobdellovibrionaceae bacterium]
MIKHIFSIMVAGFLLACSSPKKTETGSVAGARTPQQAAFDYESEEDQKNEQTFQNLMNQPTDVQRSKEFGRFLRKQMGNFYIAQGLVNQFDKELDKVYQAKKKDVDSEPDQKKLEEIIAKLQFTRELYERNLHEMTYLYGRLLEEAGKPASPLQRASEFVLSSMKKFLDDGWKQGDQMAVLSLAQDYAEAGRLYKEMNPGGKTPGFTSYYVQKAENDKELTVARAQSIKFHDVRRKRYVDRVLEKDWTDYLAKRKVEADAEAAADRQPNTDVLYPSAGGAGHVTGNRFKNGFWAITFDDGPHPTHTQGMIDAMNSGGYEGTFFWLTQNMTLYPKIVAKAGTEGFKRGSHSYSHANLPKLGPKDLSHEINDASDGFKQVVGHFPTLFRCPYGACGGNNSKIRQQIADRKMMHVFWNVDSLDWQDKNAASIFQRVKKQMEVNGRGIVLYHDIHPQSVKATKMMVDWMSTEKKAWKVMTMDRMIQEETADPNSPSKNYTSP